jgi:hypothetical protein
LSFAEPYSSHLSRRALDQSEERAPWYNFTSLGPRTFAVFFATFLIGGCAKRQTGPRVVYVPAPPPAASPASGQASNAPSGSQGTWVIEEPAPPPPPPVETEEAPAPAPAPAPVVRRPRRTRPEETPEGNEVPTPDPNQPAITGETPQLEPRSSPASRDALLARHAALEQRIKSIEHSLKFTAVDRRTLQDARGFLFQSERALQAGDMLRAEQLAEKASLLLAALEQR